MEETGKFRKKLSEQQILDLTDKERQSIEKFNEYATRLEQAEANKESQQKIRILFERAPKETLPFLVYCIYVAAAGLSSFFYLISNFETPVLYWLLGFLIIILVLPVFILPKLHFKNWIKKYK